MFVFFACSMIFCAFFCDLPYFFGLKKSFHFENDYEWNPISFEIWYPWTNFVVNFACILVLKIEIYYIK